MAVNCMIRLPRNVRVNDVMNVAGRLSGLPIQKVPFQRNDGWYAQTQGASVETTSAPGMVQINVGYSRYVYYHFEDDRADTVLMNPGSCPFWIAIAKGLADFFGGEIVHQDNKEKTDYKVRFKADKLNRPEHGESWEALQERMLALKPITKDAFLAAQKVAAHDESAREYKFDADGYLVAPLTSKRKK